MSAEFDSEEDELQPERSIKLRIASKYEYKAGHTGERFVEYTIFFELHDTNTNEKLQHQISDRYSGLAGLHKRISKGLQALPGSTITLPSFPPKSATKHMLNEEEVKQRKRDLSKYFTRLLSHPELLKSSIVRAELKMRDNPAFHNKLREFVKQRDTELEYKRQQIM